MRSAYRLVFLALLLGTGETGQAITVDLTSGTTGIMYLNQSFNETRGVTAFVLGSTDLNLLSMRLDGFTIALDPGGTVRARVYADDTGALIAAADSAVSVGSGQSVTIPISATLTAGSTYRFAFFVSNEFIGGGGDMLDPDPQNALDFLYVDSTGLFRIGNAWDGFSDEFPTTPNRFVPLMFLEVASVPIPAAVWLLGSALVVLGVMRRREVA